MPTFTTDSGQVVGYTDYGGDGPPLVLLHALFMNRNMFRPQVEALGDSHRIITVDLRGHGDSPTSAPIDFWDVARDVIAVLDHLGIDRASIAGTSQGSIVALRVAFLRPDLVASLVLMGSSADVEPPEAAETLRGIAAGWRQYGPADPLLEQIAGAVLGDYPDVTSWYEVWRTLDTDVVERNTEAVIARDAVIEQLPDLKMPALVLHGSADNVFPVTEGEKLAKGLPGSGDAIIIEGGAHFLSLAEADAVNEQLSRFLGSERQAASAASRA